MEAVSPRAEEVVLRSPIVPLRIERGKKFRRRIPMKQITWKPLGLALLILASVPLVGARERDRSRCKPVHADLVEDGVTVGCKPGHSSCFLGEVDGNHGLRGTTYFRADDVATGPDTSPEFISYSGIFEYETDRGTLSTRETGVVNTTVGGPASGAVTAYQQILEATGEFTGVTGHFFVSGFSRNQHVVTRVTGQLCYPE
jgi:hypothetical protein